MRIVSLLPSATEIVCALGFEDRLVGVSHSCNYPPGVVDLPVVTSTRVPHEQASDVIDTYVREHLSGHEALYDLDIDRLRELEPDIVVSQALCDVCAVATGDVVAAIEALPTKPDLVDLTPNTLADVFEDIRRVGALLGAGDRADAVVSDLLARCDRVSNQNPSSPPRVSFLEWLIPPFNGGHWNPELVRLAGGIDLLGSRGRPSSTIDWETVAVADPDVLFIACCGFRVDRAMLDVERVAEEPLWNSLRAVREGRVYITDGNAYFSSPGPRLIDGLEIMAHALKPDVHALPEEAPIVRLQ